MVTERFDAIVSVSVLFSSVEIFRVEFSSNQIHMRCTDGCTVQEDDVELNLKSFVLFFQLALFLRKKSTTVMAFRKFFFDTPEVTQIVRPKVLQKIKA